MGAGMEKVDPRSPCVIGVARRTIHPDQGDAPEPLDLWEQMAREASQDSRGRGVLEAIDDLGVVYSISWQYDDPPGRLAERLALGPGGRFYSGMSGTSPQKYLQTAAAEIAAGRREVALLVGAETLATKKRLKRAGIKPEWSHRPAEKPAMPFDDPFHPAEVAHQVFQAYLTFAVFDVARRAHLGLRPEQNLRQLGELFAPMSRIAAANPHAWLREAHTPDELITVTPSNRMVASPYPKSLVSIIDLDMASAIILTSHEKADALGVPREQRIYLRGWCHARDPVYVAERRDLHESASMRAASRVALETAGVGLDDIAHLDLYSCFPSSVNFARDALGLAADDPRPLTVTGGLPFHGGPGSNYMSHSIATMVEKLRAAPSELGLVSGVGMHMTNHVYAVYSAMPGPLRLPDEAGAQQLADAAPRCEIAATATGKAKVAAYSIVHGREGVVSGLAVCDLPGGARCYAKVDDAQLMDAMQAEEWVGREVELSDAGGGVNRVEA